MLEKPDILDEKIITCLQEDYGLSISEVRFLPLGADFQTAVYRVVATDETAYFLKLRGGDLDEASVTFPKFLSDLGIRQIIPPLATERGQVWTSIDAFTVVLYPFVEGQDGYNVTLTDRHWDEFGSVLKRMHTAKIPSSIRRQIQPEDYSSQWRNRVRGFLTQIETAIFDDPIAAQLAAFLQTHRGALLDLIGRTDQLAHQLQAQQSTLIVCHADLHAGNILIGSDAAFYIVDWDTLILAPKERDLMYIGGSLLASGLTPQEESTRFYQTYGETEIDPVAVAYYRYERIIQDFAEYCNQLLLSNEGGKDRAQSLRAVKSNFRPNGTIAMAHQAYQAISKK